MLSLRASPLSPLLLRLYSLYFRSQLDGGDCKPITSQNGKPYYPCGLIANSVFNGKHHSVSRFTDPVRHIPNCNALESYQCVRRVWDKAFLLMITADGAQNQTYNLSESGIVWSGTAKNYISSPSYPSPTDVLPPPNWALRYPDGYTDETGFPDLSTDEHLQVWMRIAALPTFRKLWARNDNEVMSQGRYRVAINMSEYFLRQSR